MEIHSLSLGFLIYYTLTVNTSGGDNTCKVKIKAPDDRPYTYTSDSVSYLIGTTCTVDRLVECPSNYKFDRWVSNNSHVNGHGNSHLPTFTLTENTTATAVFVAVQRPEVVNFRCQSEAFDPTNTGCLGAIRNMLQVEHQFDSSTGDIDDLDGYIAEILCYDTTVSFSAEVLPWLIANPDFISQSANEEGPVFSAAPQEIQLPWYSIITKPSYVTTIPRWFRFASRPTASHEKVSAGTAKIRDNHYIEATPTEAQTGGSYTMKQFFVWGHGCNQYKLLATATIVRKSYGTGNKLSIKKQAGCTGTEYIVECP